MFPRTSAATNPRPCGFVTTSTGGPLADGAKSSKFVARALAAISLYLGRLSGKEAFDLDYQGLAWPACRAEAGLVFRGIRAARVRLELDRLVLRASAVRSESGIAEVEKRGTYARDLVLRFPQLTKEHRQKLREVPDVAVAVLPECFREPARRAAGRTRVLDLAVRGQDRQSWPNADVFDERLLTKIAEELTHVIAQVGAQSGRGRWPTWPSSLRPSRPRSIV